MKKILSIIVFVLLSINTIGLYFVQAKASERAEFNIPTTTEEDNTSHNVLIYKPAYSSYYYDDNQLFSKYNSLKDYNENRQSNYSFIFYQKIKMPPDSKS